MSNMSLIKSTSFFLDRFETYSTVYLTVSLVMCSPTLGCSRLGILFENPLNLHTHSFPCVWITPVVVGFMIIGNLGLCRFLPATLGCYSLMKSVISVGVDNV